MNRGLAVPVYHKLIMRHDLWAGSSLNYFSELIDTIFLGNPVLLGNRLFIL